MRPSRTRAPTSFRAATVPAPSAELNLWKVAGIDIAKDKGPWYKEIGQGMGAALNTASASQRLYARRSRHLAPVQEPRRPRHRGRRRQAPVQPVWRHAGEPGKHPSVKKDLGQAFIDCLVSPEGQKAIADTRSTASSCSSPTPTIPARDARPRFRICRQRRSRVHSDRIDFCLLSPASAGHDSRISALALPASAPLPCHQQTRRPCSLRGRQPARAPDRRGERLRGASGQRSRPNSAPPVAEG